jgi:hypothetical protein
MSDSNDLIKAANNISELLKEKMNKSQQDINEKINLVRTNRKYQKAFIQRFVKMESWLLLSEAIPICLGYGPEYEAYAKGDKDYSKIEKLAKGLEASDLDIIDHHKPIKEWKVKPKGFVKWLSDYDQYVIDELCIHFLSAKKTKTSSTEIQSSQSVAVSERHAATREQVYIAVIAILANFHEQCIGRNGEVSPTEVLRIMETKSPLWFGDEDLPLSSRRIKELIAKAVRTASKN